MVKTFWPYCPLLYESLRSPILCKVKGEGPVAFELVELVDEKKIARPTGDQEDLLAHLRDGYRSLPSATKAEFDRRFGNALVRANFGTDLSLRRRKKIADDILEKMMMIDPSFEESSGCTMGEWK